MPNNFWDVGLLFSGIVRSFNGILYFRWALSPGKKMEANNWINTMWLFCNLLQTVRWWVRLVDLSYIALKMSDQKQNIFRAHILSIFQLKMLSYIWLGSAWFNCSPNSTYEKLCPHLLNWQGVPYVVISDRYNFIEDFVATVSTASLAVNSVDNDNSFPVS